MKKWYDLNVQHTFDEKNHETTKKKEKNPKTNFLEGTDKPTHICQNYKGNKNVFFSILKKIMYNFQKS